MFGLQPTQVKTPCKLQSIHIICVHISFNYVYIYIYIYMHTNTKGWCIMVYIKQQHLWFDTWISHWLTGFPVHFPTSPGGPQGDDRSSVTSVLPRGQPLTPAAWEAFREREESLGENWWYLVMERGGVELNWLVVCQTVICIVCIYGHLYG